MGKNLLICGTGQNVDNILHRLSPECKVIGYTDCNSIFKGYSIFDGYYYKPLKEYNINDIDFVIISYSNQDNIEVALNEFEILKDKCIVYEWFKEATIVNPLIKYKDSPIDYEQLIFGMSHSQVDILTQLLNKKTYKFSLPSMDLFCQLQLLKNILKDGECKANRIKNIILELPYYIFNYDLSKSVRSVKKRLYYFKLFDDYHNYGLNEKEQYVIKQFENFLITFQYGNPEIIRNNMDEPNDKKGLKQFAYSLIDQKNVMRENNNVWAKKRPNTISDNIKIFNEFIKLLKDTYPNANITAIVCPFNPIFRLKNKRSIHRMKKMYYEEMEKKDISIIDNFELYHNPFLFNDHCHLKLEAAYAYTKYIKEQHKW